MGRKRTAASPSASDGDSYAETKSRLDVPRVRRWQGSLDADVRLREASRATEGKNEMSGTFEIACVELVVENEIKQGCNQRQIAQTYALGMRSTWPTDWARVNAMIEQRWPKGLDRVKQLAHSGKCFQPAEKKEPK